MNYHNGHFGFDLVLPVGWSGPGLLKRVLGGGHPEFYGPEGSSLKIAIGPISPVPSAEQQQSNLRSIASRYGHQVIDTATVYVGGKLHATMLCRVPGIGILKNYSVILDSMEYFFTAQGDLRECDSIVTSFKVGS